jgi:hypothetical protein
MGRDLSSLSPDALAEVMKGAALDPPPGLKSNFENPPGRTVLGFTIYTICTFLGIFFSLLRIYSRWLFLKRGYIVEGNQSFVPIGLGIPSPGVTADRLSY